MQVVWFKRDLRVSDHQPLTNACAAGPVLPIFIHEPALISAPDYAAQHAGFLTECLADLAGALALRGVTLFQPVGLATDVLDAIWSRAPFKNLWSHAEVGNDASYRRDQSVSRWCQLRGVTWHQLPQNGVLRGARAQRSNRAWLDSLETYMATPPIAAPSQITPPQLLRHRLTNGEIPVPAGVDKAARMRGGRDNAMQLLTTFLGKRILAYPHAISSPSSAESGCSRLSPYLAYGVLSSREIIAAMNQRLTSSAGQNNAYEQDRLTNALRFFADRLRWRSGYFQNMEDFPHLEFENLDKKMDGLRENEFNPDHFLHWKEGRTGYPMVDASMAMLRHTGWINMRMRGMLLSFAVNDLWLHWREPALHLAREFLDYEPAIHYNQMQIHAGTSGADHSLTYNVVKQAQDLDPDGVFVRRWLPALRNVPDAFIIEPWTMPAATQAACDVELGRDYPWPIVEHITAGRRARALVAEAKSAIPGRPALHTRKQQEVANQKQQMSLF